MTEPRTDTTFKIPEYNLPVFKRKIDKLNKRASKLGCAPVTYTDFGTEIIDMGSDFLHQQGIYKDALKVTIHIIEVKGEAPKIAGWSFIGTIEHRPSGDNILRTIPDEELPVEYRTADVKCDHCHTRRLRKNTYVVRNEAGEYKQVGRQCLRDFLGHQSPEAIARHTEWLMNLMDDLREDENFTRDNSPRAEWMFSTEHYLAWVVYWIEEKGWLSRTKAREDERYGQATADLAAQMIITPFMNRHDRNYRQVRQLADHHKEQAKQAIEWCRNELAPTVDLTSNEYTYNLVTTCKQDAIPYRDAGIVASLITKWKRSQEIEHERQDEAKKFADSDFVGQVGERITRTVEVLGVHSFDGNYGPTRIHRLRDIEGNIFTWFAHTTPLEEGNWYEVTGTVKGHDTYRGIKQTILTRCRGKELHTVETAS